MSSPRSPIGPIGLIGNNPRRVLLRHIAAAGCLLCVPALWSCGRKEPVGELRPSPAPAEPPATAPAASAPAEPSPGAAQPAPVAPKLNKQQVQYQEQPKGPQKCANCQHFVAANNSCQLVDGPISPEAWCTLWAAKAT